MTEAIKLSDMQRTNIEYERQRHLANWLIESSPHMPKPSPQQQSQQKQNKKGIFKQNPIFFLANIGNSMNITNSNNTKYNNNHNNSTFISNNNNNLSMTKSSTVFTSQTNLPLQIVSSSGRDGHKPKLRRFNSHDTSANMFSVAEFENARLARRNELENAALLRQRQRYKMNSLSSGGDCSTGDSKGSKLSSESISEPLLADQFLDKFSLPRVVRLSYTSDNSNTINQTMVSSSSNESNSNYTGGDKKKKSKQLANQLGGELFLLYRHLRDYKIYHVLNTKNGANRKKGLKIPQDFPGYFSLINEKGTPTATAYSTIVQLVRERVYKFLSVDNLPAYTESHSSDNFNHKAHYARTTAKAGQVYRLLAVFQDGDHKSSSTTSQKDTSSIKSGSVGGSNEKERGKYAQLLGDNRQIYYVSLSAKGKFFEIEQHPAQILQKCNSLGNSSAKLPKQLNPECVHRICNILQSDIDVPANLKFISGVSNDNGGNHNIIPEYVTLVKITTENYIVACPIDETESCTPLHLIKLHITPQMKFVKCFMGFENEQRMFSNPNVQNILKFCQFNCDNFTRSIDYDTNFIDLPTMTSLTLTNQMSDGSKPKTEVLKMLNFTKLFSGSEKHVSSGHEKEDSIIFLSKNDLENMESSKEEHSVSMSSTNLNDKMKVFQPTKRRWFKNLRGNNETTQYNSMDADLEKNKRSSMERYKDMSKLIQERFGDIEINAMEVINKANSDVGYDDNSDELRKRSIDASIQKCLSLQNIEMKNNTQMDSKNRHKPDLVNNIKTVDDDGRVEIGPDMDETMFYPIRDVPNQQSFMTEKLYNEFHVKTKQYSKSSSSLHHLLHLAVPQKMSVHDIKKKSNQNASFSVKKKTEELLSFEDLKNLHYHNDIDAQNEQSSLSILDDLPYSSVRDSIIIQDSEVKTPESIYAEICSENPLFHTVTPSPKRPEKSISSIRISVSNNNSCQMSHHHEAGTSGGKPDDNIYNTIK